MNAADDPLPLRDYQIVIESETRDLLRQGAKSVLIVCSTGSGKTVTAASILRKCAAKGKRAWFVNHRKELINQSVKTLHRAGVRFGVVSPHFRPNPLEYIQVGSIQTLVRRHANLDPPDIIVWDESHHLAARTWDQVYSAYPDIPHLGLTATPVRTDGTGLGRWFQHMVVGPPAAELMRLGWLSKYRIFSPGIPDMTGVHTVAGDYNKKEMDDRLKSSAVVGDALAHYQRITPGRRALVFMWSIESSKDMVARFNAAGVPAAHVDGDTDDRQRDRTVNMFAEGKLLVMSNVDLFGEGYDCPACDVGFFLRPTQSLGLWLQQVGRILRPAEDKVAFLFDHAGNWLRHGLPDDPREWSLAGLEKTRKRKKDDDEPKLRACPKCNEIHRVTVRECDCGYIFPVQSRQVSVDHAAELAEIDQTLIRQHRNYEQSKSTSLEELVQLGIRRGYAKPQAWARMVLKSREEKELRRKARALANKPAAKEESAERWLF